MGVHVVAGVFGRCLLGWRRTVIRQSMDGDGVAREMLNVRVEQWLDALIERATRLSGAKSKSQWAREALEAGARREISAAESRMLMQQQPLGGGFLRSRKKCVHPPTARVDHIRCESCALCGTVTRVKQ